MIANPSYGASSNPQDSTRYSSHGPQDTPPNTSTTAETPFSTYDIIGSPVAGRHAPSQEAVYNVLEGPPAGRGRGLEEGDYQEVEGEEGGEGEYHVLGEIGGEGETYEVPVSSKTTVQHAATTEYSSLQHK